MVDMMPQCLAHFESEIFLPYSPFPHIRKLTHRDTLPLTLPFKLPPHHSHVSGFWSKALTSAEFESTTTPSKNVGFVAIRRLLSFNPPR
jgi:hypothetical protein